MVGKDRTLFMGTKEQYNKRVAQINFDDVDSNGELTPCSSFDEEEDHSKEDEDETV